MKDYPDYGNDITENYYLDFPGELSELNTWNINEDGVFDSLPEWF